ncbi:hypothetical protein C0992_009434 [Termitomyces sp. T32_za158]|nr:hypothetical protein C0992_009434 [Termitomyces sp. T32_za158]
MLSNSNKRKRVPKEQIEHYDDINIASPTIQLSRHLDLGVSMLGFSRRSIVHVPIAPSEITHPSPVSYTWNTDTTAVSNGDPDDIFSFESIDPDYEHEPVNASIELTKRRRTTAMDNPLREWTTEIDLYVHELLRLEAPAGNPPFVCANEHSDTLEKLYRCIDCIDGRLLCSLCITTVHSVSPFHRIEEWKDASFAPTTLQHLGLQMQLGHAGDQCENPLPPTNLVVLHTNGIHSISVLYCDCTQSIPRHVQLLRTRLFPATTIYPQTAATFHLLKGFQLLSFMSKVSAFEFYQTLVRLTDNTGTVDLPDRYAAFLRMVHEWRHIKMLKRAARGHDLKGVKGTQSGECAVLCPACPYPGVNIPSNLTNVPAGKQWLYSLFLGIDANFRLKRLNVSSQEQDPGLNHGYAYFVEESAFKSYLNRFGTLVPDDISTCNNHDAIKSASIRGGKGIDASGVGKVECARHDMKRPVSVGDLQKGERYVNMDYFVFSSIRQNTPKNVVVSYDIICQWAKHLVSRAETYATANEYHSHSWTFLVPKFHLPAHCPECQVNFSFNFTRHVGRTDGEAPERGWAAINAISTSTKEMGPGSRRDTLDDHFSDYNWRKIVTLASTFCRKVEEAVTHRAEHTLAFEEFSAALPKNDINEWRGLVEAWEEDGKKVNPFAASVQKISESSVRLELAQEDEAQLKEKMTVALHDDVPPSRLIAQGLELEDHQRVLCIDTNALGPHATDLQRSKLIERGNQLFRKIEAWMKIQTLYMPQVAVIRARAEHAGSAELPSAIDVDLLLPSSLIHKAPCDAKFLDYEWRLRFAQAHGVLHEMRRSIVLRSQMYKSKDTLVRGQRMHTRSLALLAKVQGRINTAANKYRRVREILVTLAQHLSKVGWDSTLQPLADEDLRGITAEEEGLSEGRRTMSWIWRTDSGIESLELGAKQEVLRIEWCKARARAHRWQEECLLLEEEMRRVMAFFRYKQEQWLRLSTMMYKHTDAATARGLQAYAQRQAELQSRLLERCATMWKDLPSRLLAPPPST